MPFRPRTSRSSYRKKTFKRRTSRPYKKRYTRKPNTINRLTMKAPVAARSLKVKLPWVKTFEFVGSAEGFTQSFSFHGNSVFPWCTEAQTNAVNTVARLTTGDNLPAGIVQYSNLYDRYYVSGNKISIEATIGSVETDAQNAIMRAVLLAVPFNNNSNLQPSTMNDTWEAVRNQLDGYNYEQLLGWPYAKWKMIGSNNGSFGRLKFNMFRKTKSMCGVKDLIDNVIYQSNLVDGATAFSNANSQLPNYSPQNGYMYYLRFFNESGEDNVLSVNLTVRMMIYFTMFSKEFTPTTLVTVTP